VGTTALEVVGAMVAVKVRGSTVVVVCAVGEMEVVVATAVTVRGTEAEVEPLKLVSPE
jgi:hypothetical protein